MTEPCIITLAITGSLPRKEDNPAMPISLAALVDSTHEARKIQSLPPRGGA